MLPAVSVVNSDDQHGLLPSVSEGGENMTSSPLTISQYDQLILTTENALAELHKSAGASSSDINQMEQLRVDQARARNALLPIQTLPHELLLKIWKHMAYESALKGTDGVWVLAQVSKAWADVILGSSDLWCDINNRFSQRRTRWALQRSLERPIHVFLGTESGVEKCFDAVLPHCHRWRELRLAVGLPEITMTLRVISLPILEHLELRVRPGPVVHVEPPNLLASPSLRTLMLHSVPLDWPSPSVPAGLRSLGICNIRAGPTFSQLLAILSSTPILEELRLEVVPLTLESGPPVEQQKPADMPYLQRIRIVNLTRGITTRLLLSIRANQCRSLVATPLDLSTLPDSARNLRKLLAQIASSPQEIFLDIGGSTFAFAVVSTYKPSEPFTIPPITDRSGFVLGFRTDDPVREIQNFVSFVAYTPTPISLLLNPRQPWINAAIEELDWDQLPSLRQLEIKSRYDLGPIFRRLSTPHGPRHSPRWPCPNLSILKFPGMETFPDGFVTFLLDRWGPPEYGGFKIDKSRPAKLKLCHVPKKKQPEYFPPLKSHFAEVWEESVTVPMEDESTTKSGTRRPGSIGWGVVYNT
ncbi:hypothetical protein M407DRAFT_19192 [Tulasnella calospora MUT 4182]|uniref:F-box domain-containing protein n=1 Tax=Tulasnella calospora MUT 4182 TaxID=1051891 RepID=A0A0C3QU77_9AGAM|nr:hypothetical protein M407DRAFT_19192 [Tulasnella calospora MUT 4182]